MQVRRWLPVSLLLACALPLQAAAVQAIDPGSAPGPAAAAGGIDRSREFAVAEAAEKARLIAARGDLGLPALEPVTESSPRDSIHWADRRFVNQEPPSTPADTGPTLVSVLIPTSGTGTTVPELLWYQLPLDYIPGDPRPMVIVWHGYGFSANSVQLQSTVDEECNARGWIYLSVTGIDDVIFGTPVCQQNVDAAINYMLNTFSVDPDRLYMAGWSMGAGCIANYAARHRNPDGIMIAALGLVSGTYDWAETYGFGTSALKTIMQNELNFGGSVIQQLFRYQQASSLYNTPGTYPPAPGVNNAAVAMGDNLDTLPVYMTWDTGDPIVENPPAMGAQLAALIASVGGTVETYPVSGTVDPVTMLPAPHSWAVLNEVALFDFFTGKVANRTPASFKGQLDVTSTAGFAQTVQKVAKVFTYVDGSGTGGELRLDSVVNVTSITADIGDAGLSGTWPLRVVAESVDANGYTLRLTGADQPPSFLLQSANGSLVTGVDSDPLTGTLIVNVSGTSTLDVQVISVPWTGQLTSTPNPVPIGTTVDLDLNANAGTSVLAFLIISAGELLTPIKDGYTITASVLPPAIVVQIPLDGLGDFSISGTIPNDVSLVGLRLPMQAVTINPSSQVDTVSNLWGLRIQ